MSDEKKKTENGLEKEIKELEALREKAQEKWMYDMYTDMINHYKKINVDY